MRVPRFDEAFGATFVGNSGVRDFFMVAPLRNDAVRVVASTDGRMPVAIDPRSLAIHAQNLTIQYPVAGASRASLKSAVMSAFGHREISTRPIYVDAVRAINVDVRFGERVALIGHNGSGKSTLLRALAGIYPPKTGSITVAGRIGTLLDIGLGFEGEATGRENIYYRGMAMGYSRRQLRQVEQQIVSFADLGEFIDLPFRTYSAGMQVRLGFAVSTQFNPEILLVDEVFGAGDAKFAKRAVERMMEIVKGAGIVVIATHDLTLVSSIATRVVWLSAGQVVLDGPPTVVLPRYQSYMNGEATA